MPQIDFNVILLAVVSLAAVGVYLAWARGGGDSSARADSWMQEGMLFKQRNDYVQAEMKLEKALAEFEASKNADVSKTISCLVALANVYESNGKPEKAREAFKRVLDKWKAQLAHGELSVIDIDYAVSNMDFGRATYDVAEFYIDSIVVMRERTLPKGHTDTLNSHKLGAQLLRKAGYTAEADELEARGQE
jgi:tetratricopeptide (TPR) repeat protein